MVLAMLGGIVSGPSLVAQSYYGAIRGLVTDPNQGILAGARGTLINEGTAEQRVTITSGSGEYSFNDVVPGTLYRSLRGFGIYPVSSEDHHHRNAIPNYGRCEVRGQERGSAVYRGPDVPRLVVEDATDIRWDGIQTTLFAGRVGSFE
jgi:hypothetical protein